MNKYKDALTYLRSSALVTDHKQKEMVNQCTAVLQELIDKAMVIFARLIEDHFDNPPLKFEELEVGMWVWDNELRMYFLIKGKFNITVGSYKVLEIITSNLSNGTWHYNTCHIYYQENRFYRKQVE